MRHVWGRREMQTGFWWGAVQERGHVELLGVDGKTVLIRTLKK
jgi:hypothetical protein